MRGSIEENAGRQVQGESDFSPFYWRDAFGWCGENPVPTVRQSGVKGTVGRRRRMSPNIAQAFSAAVKKKDSAIRAPSVFVLAAGGFFSLVVFHST